MTDQLHDEETTSSRFSRRTVLKGAGVGAAAVWAAPTVLSLNSVASASVAPPQKCEGCNPNDDCGGQSNCGDPQFGCTCKPVELGGQCVCTGNGSCSDFQSCSAQSDCAAGFTCTTSCCNDFGFPNLCLPNCGTQAAAKAAKKVAHGPRTTRL